jgi:hypothetical protein
MNQTLHTHPSRAQGTQLALPILPAGQQGTQQAQAGIHHFSYCCSVFTLQTTRSRSDHMEKVCHWQLK